MTKVAVETVDTVRRRLAVEVPEADVRAEIERAYATLRRTAKVRGFRPGHAPRAVLERLFGDQVRAEVFGKLIQESLAEAVREQQLQPVGTPEVVTEQAEPDRPLRYSVTIEVKPEVVASGYHGLEADRPIRPVDEADVERFLHDLRDSLAQLHPIDDRTTAQRGDMVTADYEARLGERVVGRGEGRVLEVGAHLPATALGAQLEGVEIGVPKDVTIDYPSDHSSSDLAGQRVVVHVTIKSLARKELPPLDDEFAKDHGECDTLDALRQRVRQQLEAGAAREADESVRSHLVDQLVRMHDIEVPQAMVERRTDALIEEFIQALGQRRPPASRESEFRTRLRDEFRERARQQVKASLVLEAIARQEHLTISDDELEAQIDRFADRAGNAGERVRALYQDPDARSGLRTQILRERALDSIVEHARVRSVEARSSVAEGEGNG